MLALLLVAASLGLSNFAASIGIGVGGADARTRLRVGIIFGGYETVMPILGLLAGRSLASTLGHAAHWVGGALLIATGLAGLAQAIRRPHNQHEQIPQRSAGRQTERLLVTGIALSIDNLAVGFALGAYHVGLAVAAIVIGAVSVTMSLIGLELGHQLGYRAGERGEILGGLVLVGVGIAIATRVLRHAAIKLAVMPGGQIDHHMARLLHRRGSSLLDQVAAQLPLGQAAQPRPAPGDQPRRGMHGEVPPAGRRRAPPGPRGTTPARPAGCAGYRRQRPREVIIAFTISRPGAYHLNQVPSAAPPKVTAAGNTSSCGI